MKKNIVGKYYRQPHEGWPSVEDLQVFITVARNGSFSRAALELGQSASYISKRIALLEKNLNTRLFFRNNRMVRLTVDGENALSGAIQLVEQMGDYVSSITEPDDMLSGNITISCSFGFGNEYVAGALSGLIRSYPGLKVKLLLSDRDVDLVEEGIDIEIHVGNDFKEIYIAKKLATNRRILCASPDYLHQAGMPSSIDELVDHHCLMLQERNAVLGNWVLTDGQQEFTCRLNTFHTSNSGSVVLTWALLNHGIVLRSTWDVEKYIENGKLIHILPQWYQEADIWAVYPQRPSTNGRIKTCITYLTRYFSERF
ncbi:LysR family transcriptional regulator [Klebsiella pneumoniae]|uniref:LysR family transcriptional regulator n=9 Tax=Bacteria TaxID=2 RepID=A0A7G5F761_KLEPN|nr:MULTISPECIES: LysR family transcriptional regulator [Klebsiella]HCP9969371.1 LysR family transcriptional regulator [Escherichia coli]ANK44675.1 LysR family transcriptional regulator [Klebsiella pneumoniae]EJQ7907764.1 LysR family transcriptional regulator [Klebsiella pneumoniae]EKV8611983.1 LysR family transcriptional regulator [Klebsiella pneumoniae]EKW5451018.1 LysR family transcriptional regulator [Klebsiella pneumoniae]